MFHPLPVKASAPVNLDGVVDRNTFLANVSQSPPSFLFDESRAFEGRLHFSSGLISDHREWI
jgi:hypothetical protein